MIIVIVDDEQSAISALSKKLGKYPETKIAGISQRGLEGLEIIKHVMPELLFLDIEMPDISGIDFLDRMKELNVPPCRVVIYSSYEGYMLPAFRKEAFDFLHKPIEDTELDAVMDRFYAHQQDSIAKSETSTTEQDAIINTNNKNILLYTNAIDFRLIHIEDIGLFCYNRTRRMWEVIVSNEKTSITLKRSVTSKMIHDLSPHFIQVHQSYIINFNYLSEVTDNKCHFYPPFDSIDFVRVGRLFRHKLVERFCNL